MLVLIIIGISARMLLDNTPVLLKGETFDYAFPPSLVTSHNSAFALGSYKGDEASSFSVMFNTTLLVDNNPKPVEFMLMIHNDHVYTKAAFKTFASSMVEGLEKASQKNAKQSYAIFIERIQENVHHYYATFDPDDLSITLDDSDFFASRFTAPSFVISGRKTIPKPSCTIHSVLDGFSVKANFAGDTCSSTNLQDAADKVIGFMINLRTPKL